MLLFLYKITNTTFAGIPNNPYKTSASEAILPFFSF